MVIINNFKKKTQSGTHCVLIISTIFATYNLLICNLYFNNSNASQTMFFSIITNILANMLTILYTRIFFL